MPIRAEDAAANNALWCDAVCRAHGRPGELSAQLWLNRAPAPPQYPNLVTLDRAAGPALEAVRTLGAAGLPAGWAVKDSFGTLPLQAEGFRVLFEAEWIVRGAESGPAESALRGRRSELRWTRIDSAAGLLAWETAWGESRGETKVFLPALLDRADVAILGAVDGKRGGGPIVAGVIANRTGDLVGVSNLFGRGPEGDAVRADAIHAVSDAFPGLPLGGYESGAALTASRTLGFRSVGPLRVWVRTS